MTKTALRDKLFHALRGELWPGNPELDQMALADVDAIMPIIEQHWEEEKKAWAEVLEPFDMGAGPGSKFGKFRNVV